LGDEQEQPVPAEQPAPPEPEIPFGEVEWSQKGGLPPGTEQKVGSSLNRVGTVSVGRR
jgi:hypothetical protein